MSGSSSSYFPILLSCFPDSLSFFSPCVSTSSRWGWSNFIFFFISSLFLPSHYGALIWSVFKEGSTTFSVYNFFKSFEYIISSLFQISHVGIVVFWSSYRLRWRADCEIGLKYHYHQTGGWIAILSISAQKEGVHKQVQMYSSLQFDTIFSINGLLYVNFRNS